MHLTIYFYAVLLLPIFVLQFHPFDFCICCNLRCRDLHLALCWQFLPMWSPYLKCFVFYFDLCSGTGIVYDSVFCRSFNACQSAVILHMRGKSHFETMKGGGGQTEKRIQLKSLLKVNLWSGLVGRQEVQRSRIRFVINKRITSVTEITNDVY